MSNAMKSYLRLMNKKFGYHAIWVPSRKIEVGQVGMFHNDVFTPYTSLEKLGIPMEVSTKNTDDYLEFKSSSSVKVSVKAHGKTNPDFAIIAEGEAGFAVSFASQNSIYFKGLGVSSHVLENLHDIHQEVRGLEQAGVWQNKYVIITEVLETKSATILISNSSNSMIELRAKGAQPGGVLDIADVGMGLEHVREIGIDTKILAKNGITPLYKVVGLSNSGLKTRSRSLDSDIFSGEPSWETIGFPIDTYNT